MVSAWESLLTNSSGRAGWASVNCILHYFMSKHDYGRPFTLPHARSVSLFHLLALEAFLNIIVLQYLYTILFWTTCMNLLRLGCKRRATETATRKRSF